MASLNKVMLIGNAGKDAELRYLSTGTPKSEFSLAVNNRRKSPSGEWEDQTEWFNIVIFGDTAERVSQYITKGKSVYVEGRLQTRTWDNDQGVKQYRTEVICNTLQLLGGRESGSGGGGGGSRDGWDDNSAPPPRPRAGSYSGPRGGGGESDPDDLPFE